MCKLELPIDPDIFSRSNRQIRPKIWSNFLPKNFQNSPNGSQLKSSDVKIKRAK